MIVRGKCPYCEKGFKDRVPTTIRLHEEKGDVRISLQLEFLRELSPDVSVEEDR